MNGPSIPFGMPGTSRWASPAEGGDSLLDGALHAALRARDRDPSAALVDGALDGAFGLVEFSFCLQSPVLRDFSDDFLGCACGTFERGGHGAGPKLTLNNFFGTSVQPIDCFRATLTVSSSAQPCCATRRRSPCRSARAHAVLEEIFRRPSHMPSLKVPSVATASVAVVEKRSRREGGSRLPGKKVAADQ